MFHVNLPFASGLSHGPAVLPGCRGLQGVRRRFRRDALLDRGAGGFHDEMRDFSNKKLGFNGI